MKKKEKDFVVRELQKAAESLVHACGHCLEDDNSDNVIKLAASIAEVLVNFDITRNYHTLPVNRDHIEIMRTTRLDNIIYMRTQGVFDE